MLVDLPNWVGDQMMSMPALQRLVEGNHRGETVLHTRPPMIRFLAAVFPEAGVVASPRKASPFSSSRMVREEGGRFEIGITLRNAARAKILTRLGSKWSIGSRGEGAFALLSEPCLIDKSRHQVHDADPILAALGLDCADPSWRPSLPSALQKEGEIGLHAVGVDRNRAVGLAPATARGEAKRWPIERYGEIAARLSARGYEPVVVIGPGEAPVAEALCVAAGRKLPVIGENRDVAGLAALTAVIRVLVGNDSGPMQVAARFGTPVVAIFGPTEPGRTGPLGGGHRTVSCSPDRSNCIRNVSVDEILAAISDLLDVCDQKPA
jgi:heptosyltransferase-2